MMKKVLVTSYFFPPLGGGGIQRVLKFVKYLPEFEWEPIVLTVDQGGWTVNDKTLADENYLSERKIIRLEAPETARHFNLRKKALLTFRDKSQKRLLQFKHFFTPDPMMNWADLAGKRLGEIIKSENIDLVYTTCPPLSGNKIGYIAKKKFGIPWVADFRDSIETSLVPDLWRSRLKSFFGRKYERMAVQTADKVLAINAPILDYLCENYGKAARNKIEIISNGYDEKDFSSINEADVKKVSNAEKFVLTYTGGFQGVRTPEYFLQGLDLFLKKDKSRVDKIEVRFIGEHGQKVKILAQQMDNSDCVKILAPVPYRQSLVYQKATDVLLLFVLAKHGLGGEQVLTGKVFEYLRSRKFIFAMAPENGALSELISTHKTGTVASQDDPRKIASELEKVFMMWQNGELAAFNDALSIPGEYDRRALTAKLSEVFNNLVKE